jgi:hypothetical protein
MKTIIFNDSNISVYVWENDVEITTTEESITCSDFLITDMNSNNATIYEDITPPSGWQSGKYFYDGSDWTLNNDWIDTKPTSDTFLWPH